MQKITWQLRVIYCSYFGGQLWGVIRVLWDKWLMVQRVFPRHLTWSRRLERGPGGLGLGCWVGACCVPKDGGLDGSRLDVGTLQSTPGCTGTS